MHLAVPGIKQPQNWFSTNHDKLDTPILVGGKTEIINAKTQMGLNRLYYVKLHGSFNWRLVDKPRLVVIGRDKEAIIGRDPLLSWYFEIFQECLNSGKARLLIIGYGFGDPHINKALALAIQDSNLSIYILNTTPAEELLLNIKRQQYGKEIIQSIGGIYPVALKDLFPASQTVTPDWEKLIEQFFGRNNL